MKSNKEIARSIAETVYSLQSEGDFFYSHLEDDYGIPDKFAEKVLADEDHKEVMITQMTADVLADIIRDTEEFMTKHSDEDHDDGVGYHPDDLDYDFRMTNYIVAIHSDANLRAKFYDQVHKEMPVKKYRVRAKFITYGYAEIEAICYDAAMEAAEMMDGADFIPDEKEGDWSVDTAEEIE